MFIGYNKARESGLGEKIFHGGRLLTILRIRALQAVVAQVVMLASYST